MNIKKITACARCGLDHNEPIMFKLLKRPLGDFTHWATCPTNGEVILLKIETVTQNEN